MGNIAVAIHSYVGSGSIIKGNLECHEGFIVEGSVEGNLRSDGAIVLGREAVVQGDVTARELAVSGIVIGTIRCSVRLEVFKPARISGAIQAPLLKIESGASIYARIIMSKPPKTQRLISHCSEGF